MTGYDRIVRDQMALERISDIDLETLDLCFEAGYDAGRWSVVRAPPTYHLQLPADCVRSRENGFALGMLDRCEAP